jgi:hypothetical protein
MTNSSPIPGSSDFAGFDAAGEPAGFDAAVDGSAAVRDSAVDESAAVLEETVIEELVIVNDDGTIDDVIIVGEIDSDAAAGLVSSEAPSIPSDANTWTEGSDDDPEVIPGTTEADIQAP